ncbi:putative HNHc nuclease [Selenomonas noxia]|uniref:putative HNHc nuclease n=1 Tax=Selenomonas noxia TaxID=135083 RepID=UPI002880309E|nr:putative HNHc nuclease [Selenomonas noxia]
MILVGSVVGETDRGINIFVPFPERIDKLYGCHESVGVEFVDKRRISTQQRKKAYVLISYIAAWWGYTPLECMKEMLKLMFVGEAETLRRSFSLSNCDMTTARLFITYLIDFCLLHGVDVGEPLYQLSEDIPRYVWACLMNKRCAVCGRKAELHHVDAVGMGRNRKEICHIGMRALPLCREHHTEIHAVGREDFLKRYILEPVKIDERIAKVYRLKAR